MTRLPAPAAEPRRTRGGAGGAGRGQWVPYSLRLILDADTYAPADLNVYGKWRALSHRRRATASVEKVAGWLGVSVSTVERANRRLGRPAPTDGVVELHTKRQTHKITGTGQTAERWTRNLDPGERYVHAPVLAAETLRPVLHRIYLLARYTQIVERRDLTLAEIATVLRHHSGKKAGQPITEAAASRLLTELEATGWASLDRRAGYRGRHRITIHDHPVHAVDEPTTPATAPDATPDPGDGSGPDLGDGSLAYREDQELNDPGTAPAAGGGFRRRRDDRKWVRPPVDTAGNTEGGRAVVPAPFQGPARPPAPPAYAGPPLTLSRDAWAVVGPVLAPVSDLLPRVGPWAIRRIVREILRQTREGGIWPQDIADQVTRLRAWTPSEEITDPGRWLLGAVLPVRSRCGMTGCHWGVVAHTGMPCKACAEIQTEIPPSAAAARGRPPHTGTSRWHECLHCQAPARTPLPDGLCATCHPTHHTRPA
ncbi:hypothetical protein ACIPEL_15255 [Streptomyces griseoviridis]